MATITQTPLMKQYEEMKKKHPDAILLFRVGDFYECFKEDAVAVSEICGVTLTQRANGANGEKIYLAGFPHYALDAYLPKLVRAGKRAAICEELVDPKLSGKVVKRGNGENETKPKAAETKQPQPRKFINYDYDLKAQRELGEPIALFTMTIPKEAANLGKLAAKNDFRPIAQVVAIEPERGKIIVTDTRILSTMDMQCEGNWPTAEENNGEVFTCSIDPKAMRRLAGKSVDVAVYKLASKKYLTSIEEPLTLTQCEMEGQYPQWERVIPDDNNGIRIAISQEELKPLRQWLKEYSKEADYLNIQASPEADTITMRLCKEFREDVCEPRQFKLQDIGGYVKAGFPSKLFYLAVEGDFNGVFYVRNSRPANFKGEMRETVLMPYQTNDGYCQTEKPENK